MQGSIVITIDGPAATGKTSVAHAVARRLSFDFLDTGAMYRAAALIAIDQGLVSPSHPIDPALQARIVQEASRASLVFDWSTSPPTLLCDGKSVMSRIRDDDVTSVVSPIAGIKPLRQIMVAKQRQIAADHPQLVTEGRDQGTIVFPGAAAKFYLDAEPMVRASRRRVQMLARRDAQSVTEPVPNIEQIAHDLRCRDRADAAEGRLLQPPDAIYVDTTDLSFDQVVAKVVEMARSRISRATPTSQKGLPKT